MSKITIKTTQINLETGESQKEKYSYNGVCTKKADAYFINYNDVVDGDTTGNTLRISKGYIRRVTRGTANTVIEFKEGIETKSEYATPYGLFVFRFTTKYIDIKEVEGHLIVTLEYTLSDDNASIAECEMNIVASV